MISPSIVSQPRRDVDHAAREVEVVDPQRHQLAAAQSRAYIAVAHSARSRGGSAPSSARALLRCRDPICARRGPRAPRDPLIGIDRDLVRARARACRSRAATSSVTPTVGGLSPSATQPVDEVLDVVARHLREPLRRRARVAHAAATPPRRPGPSPACSVARARPDHARRAPVEPLAPPPAPRSLRWRPHKRLRTATPPRHATRAPPPAGKRLADLLAVALRVHERLPRALAATPTAPPPVALAHPYGHLIASPATRDSPMQNDAPTLRDTRPPPSTAGSPYHRVFLESNPSCPVFAGFRFAARGQADCRPDVNVTRRFAALRR